MAAIRERLGDGPKPQVIVNRFEQRMFETGLKRADIEQALGGDFAGTIPNNYRLVREAIDRGVPLDEVKPGNNITTQLKKLIAPQKPEAGGAGVRAGEEARPWRSSRRADGATMIGRFTTRRSVAPEPAPVVDAPPVAGLDVVDRSWPRPRSSARSRRPTPPIRCCPTSCSTPRCACTAG